jgi:O-antigen ligase
MVIPLVFLLPRGRGRFVLAAATLLLLFGTWSRGAWLGLAGSLAVALILLACTRRGSGGILPGQHYLFRILAGTGAALVLLTGAAWLMDWETLLLPLERLGQAFSRHDWSNLTRIYSMQAGWRAFLLSPVVGVGWGQFGFHFPALVDPLGLQSQFTWPVVNNFPLLVLCETGLIGFLVFIGLLTGLWRGVVRCLIRTDFMDRRWRLVAVGAAFAGVWLQLLTFSQYNLPHIWVVLGLVLAATAENQTRRDGDEV